MSYLCDSVVCEDQMHKDHQHGCVKSDLIKIHVTTGLRSGRMYPDTSTPTGQSASNTIDICVDDDEDKAETKYDHEDDNIDDICIDIDDNVVPVLLPIKKHQCNQSTQTVSTTRTAETQTNHSCVYKVRNTQGD